MKRAYIVKNVLSALRDTGAVGFISEDQAVRIAVALGVRVEPNDPELPARLVLDYPGHGDVSEDCGSAVRKLFTVVECTPTRTVLIEMLRRYNATSDKP